MSEPSANPDPAPAEASPPPPPPDDPALAGTTPVFGGPAGPRRVKNEDILPLDFRQPTLLTPGELRKIRLRHEDFTRALSASLSSYLRTEFTLRLTKLHTVVYQKHVTSLPTSTHLTLFKVEPLKGICLLDLTPRLGLTIVERLLGGPGQPSTENRELSDIESALLDEVVMVILKDWCAQWHKYQALTPALLGHETSPRFLHTSPRDTILLVLVLEATLGECTDTFQIAFPYPTIEPIVRHLASESALERDGAPKGVEKPRWKSEYAEIPIVAAAEWNGLELTVRALTALKPGDVLMLGPESSDQVLVSLARAPKFRGRLGTYAQKWAVELTDVIPS